MYAWGLAVLAVVAGCDALFGLDHVPRMDASTDDAITPDDDATLLDAPSWSTHVIARFDFESTFADARSGLLATCANGACPTFKLGVHGMAADFDGVNDCLMFTLPSRPALISVAFWMNKPDDVGSSMVSIPTNDNVTNTLQLDAQPSRSLRYITYNGAASRVLSQDNAYPIGTWTHIAATFDGTKRMYVDATALSQVSSGEQISWQAMQLLIGCDRDSTFTRFFHGTLDEVIVFDVALTPAEVAALANP
jgi:hypothetical protein